MSILKINDPIIIDRMGHPISYEIDWGTKKAISVWADKEFQDKHGDYRDNPTRLTHDEGKQLAEEITKRYNNYPEMLSIIERLSNMPISYSDDNLDIVELKDETIKLLTELNK